MRKILYKCLVLFLLIAVAGVVEAQTRVVMSDGMVYWVDGILNPTGVVLDDGDSTGNYSNGFYGLVVIHANFGDTIILHGNYNVETNYDNINIYNTYGVGPIAMHTYNGSGVITDTSFTGDLTIEFSSDGSESSDGFVLYWEVRPLNCANFISTLTASNVTSTSVALGWHALDTTLPVILSYGGVDTVLTASQCTITGLSPNTDYTFSVVAEIDTGFVAECSRVLNVHTPYFQALVHGLRPLCGIDTVALTADTADGYYWSTGSTSRSISVTDTGSYYLVAYTQGGGTDTLFFRVGSIVLDLETMLPDALCPGDTAVVTVGMAEGSTVRVLRGESTLSESGRIFLPDGEYCEPNGCSYRSELVFSGFEPTAHISDVNDIRYVMLNIEHSFMGDIYINITCPNNQSADILRYGGSGTSTCNSSIASSSRGWQSGYNASTSTFLGGALDGEGYPTCDQNAYGNEPGVGWRYCWSNCTDAGFSYAPGDGLLYRSANRVMYRGYYTIDSSNVAAGTNFYHPDASFSSLVGCPMNGTWYIEVIDGWGGDNGYIFGWELALNPDRLSRTDYVPTVAYADMQGDNVSRLGDTSFLVTAPLNLSHDTTISYTVRITDSLGCVFDTMIEISFHASSFSEMSDTVDESSLPISFGGQLFYNDTTVAFHYPNNSGCDSLLVYRLVVNHNSYASFDTTFCESSLPIQWYHRIFYTEGTQYDTIVNSLGADSILTLTLHTAPSITIDQYDTICSNQSFTFEGSTYTAAGVYPHSFLSGFGCDSIRTLHLTVHNTTHGDTLATECDHFTWQWHTFAASDTLTITQYATNVNGCDSAVTLHLTILFSDSLSVSDTICEGGSLVFAGQSLTTTGVYTHTFTSYQGCDSTVSLHLTVNPTTYGDYYDTCFENSLPRTYGGITAWDDTTATIVMTGSRGCDSIVTYHLHVLHNSHVTRDTTFCESSLPIQWYHRIFYAGGTQYDTLTNHLGADSLLTLHVAIIPTSRDTTHAAVCAGSSYLFEGNSYFTAGFHSVTLVSSQWCDSIKTLHLTLNAPSHGDTLATACDQFVWHGQTFTASDTHTVAQYTTNAAGCDSAVTLHLTILHSTDSDFVVETCDSYSWFGTNYLVPPASVPTHTLVNAVGCDSTLRLTNLILHYSQQIDEFDTVCQPQLSGGYTWHDTILQNVVGSGSFMLSAIDRYGCDSVRMLYLTVYDSSSSDVYDTIVQNQAATWVYQGIALGTDTTVSLTLVNHRGCDSLVTYHLHVIANSYTYLDTTLCDNMVPSFSWNGMPAADTLVATLTGSHGEDSIVTLTLHVNPTYQTGLYDTTCANMPVYFAGEDLLVTGDYDHTFQSGLGCDSVVTLHLMVHPTYSIDYYDTIYFGDTVFFEGHGYIQPGDYPVLRQTAEGCDSLLTLHLEGRNLVQDARVDSICEGDTYLFYGQSLTEAGVYYDTVYSGDFFIGDTIVQLTLNVVERPEASIFATPYCDEPAHYALRAGTTLPYLLWVGPGVVEGHEHDSIIAVLSPSEPTLYTLYADYRSGEFCPARVDTLLAPVPVIHPLIDVRPSALTLSERHLSVGHASTGLYTSHSWYVFYNDESPFTDTAHRLELDVPMYVDSVVLVLTLANEICDASDTVTVGVLRSDILFPNVFTPSLSTNNIFKAYTTAVSDFELWIYDRRGALVYHSTDLEEGWDGTRDGSPMPQATYVYKCRYRDQLTPDGWQTTTGTVTLLR